MCALSVHPCSETVRVAKRQDPGRVMSTISAPMSTLSSSPHRTLTAPTAWRGRQADCITVLEERSIIADETHGTFTDRQRSPPITRARRFTQPLAPCGPHGRWFAGRQTRDSRYLDFVLSPEPALSVGRPRRYRRCRHPRRATAARRATRWRPRRVGRAYERRRVLARLEVRPYDL